MEHARCVAILYGNGVFGNSSSCDHDGYAEDEEVKARLLGNHGVCVQLQNAKKCF